MPDDFLQCPWFSTQILIIQTPARGVHFFNLKKKPFCALRDEEKPVSLVSDVKKSVCAVSGRKIVTNDILRVKTLIKKHLRDYPWYQITFEFARVGTVEQHYTIFVDM